MMNLTKIIRFILLLLLIPNSNAEDFGQVVPSDVREEMENVEAGESAYFPDSNHRPLDNVESTETSASVPDEEDYGDTPSGKESPTQFNTGVPYSGLDSDTYVTYTNKEILSGIGKKSKSSFSFEFFQNNFDYTDSRGVYSQTFESDSGAKGGSLHLSMDRYLHKGWLNFGYGGGFGLGYSTGKGIFAADGSASTTRFNLYSLPLDLRLLVELPIGEAIKLSFAGGPSAMGLIQNRSDRDDKEDGKERRQVGFGYAAEGKLKINLGHIFTDTGFEYYRTHEVSFMSLDLVLRSQSYSGFADEIEISGMSYGLGFTFEFL